MKLYIFDVEHGACALLETSNGRRVMIDAGHNATTRWTPAGYLAGRGITALDRLIVTNMDEDHVSRLPELLSKLYVGALTRNPTVGSEVLRRIKMESGGLGNGVSALAVAMKQHFIGDAPSSAEDLASGVNFQHFWNAYGTRPGEFSDTNNLSLVTIITYGQHKICFPGDMERPGWLQLLRNAHFRSALAGTNVFVASHHGSENGFCEEIMRAYSGAIRPLVPKVSGHPFRFYPATDSGASGHPCDVLLRGNL